MTEPNDLKGELAEVLALAEETEESCCGRRECGGECGGLNSGTVPTAEALLRIACLPPHPWSTPKAGVGGCGVFSQSIGRGIAIAGRSARCVASHQPSKHETAQRFAVTR